MPMEWPESLAGPSNSSLPAPAPAVAESDGGGLQLCAAVPKSVLLGLVVLLTIGGNTLVLLALVRTRTLRGSTACLIGSLAAADLLLGLAVLPFSAVLEVSGRWYFGAVFCTVWAAADVLCCTASILSLCVISVDRYIGVTRPLGHAHIMSGRRTMALNGLVWAVSLAISIGPLVGWRGPPAAAAHRCEVNSQAGYVLFSVLGSFYLPMLVILFVYWRIYRAVVRETRCWQNGVKVTDSQVALRIHRGGCGRRPSAGSDCSTIDECRPPEVRDPAGSGGSSRLQSKLRVQTKAAKTLGIVVGVFLLCWFPFFFLHPLRTLCSVCHIPDPVFAFFFWLGYCNSCLNPFIYVCTSREFKCAFRQILCGRRGRRRRRPSPVVTDGGGRRGGRPAAGQPARPAGAASVREQRPDGSHRAGDWR